MADRKKPGVVFWSTVVLVVALAYPLSFRNPAVPDPLPPRAAGVFFHLFRTVLAGQSFGPAGRAGRGRGPALTYSMW
jgi:hypothetical protein